MKKILGLLMAFLLMLTGCVSDEDYISNNIFRWTNNRTICK